MAITRSIRNVTGATLLRCDLLPNHRLMSGVAQRACDEAISCGGLLIGVGRTQEGAAPPN